MPMSSPDSNVELVRTSFEAFNANDIDSCLAVLAPDFVMHLAELPEPLRGRDTWREGVELMNAAFPDLHAQIEDITAAEDRVAPHLTLSVTHPGDYLGFPPPGVSPK